MGIFSAHKQERRSATSSGRRVEGALFLLLVLGVAGAPFWFGGNRPLAWGIHAVLFPSLLALYEVSRVLFSRGYAVSPRFVWPAVVAVALTVVWCALQSTTLVPVSLQHPIWQAARDTLETNIAGSVSVNRDATVLALMRLVTSAAVFWLSLQLCRSPDRARRLVWAVAVIGLGYALYGIISFFEFPNTTLWFEKVHYRESLTSTFVNRNSYATYAGLGFLSAISLMLTALPGRRPAADTTGRVAGLVAQLVGPAGAWLLVASIILLALILTGSRGGISAALLGLVTVLVMNSVLRRGKRSVVTLGGSLAALCFVSVAFTFGELLAARLSSLGLQSEDRLAVYAITWTSIWDRPLLGFGYGTFEYAFPMYRDATVGAFGVWDKAHNTYLEVMQGLGLPVAGVFFFGIGTLVWRCFVGALTRRQGVVAPLAASAASVTVLSHALGDFSLQMQGVTLTWVALLGAGVAQSWSGEAFLGTRSHALTEHNQLKTSRTNAEA